MVAKVTSSLFRLHAELRAYTLVIRAGVSLVALVGDRKWLVRSWSIHGGLL